jgi:hypothetical protein
MIKTPPLVINRHHNSKETICYHRFPYWQTKRHFLHSCIFCVIIRCRGIELYQRNVGTIVQGMHNISQSRIKIHIS